MRNLKRVLSMALASIMVLGMMVIGAGAASTYENFTDKDEIQNQEAVNTMVSLGVLNGKEDGSYFDPTGIVTRGEMAKIIAVMLNGGKDPVQGSNTSTNFTDTKGNWAEPYIAFCVNQKILAGRGDGTFRPNDPVTGSAFAKAVLCALGYRADLEGMVNDLNWEMNTNILANKVGLYDGLENIKASEGLSRDNVAQLIYNGVQADEVMYDNLYGDHSDVIQTVKNGTMLENRFGVVKVEGVVVANEVFGIDGNSATTKDKVRLADTNTYSNSSGATVSYGAGPYPVSVSNDMMGKRIVLYVKFPNALAPNAATSIVVGEPILSEQNTVVENSAKLKDLDKVKDALKGSGISVVTSGNDATKLVLIDEKGLHESTSANPGVSMIPGVQQTFIDNDNDGKVEYVIQVKEALSKVSVYNSGKEELTLTGIGSVDFVDIANPDDVAKDDYVLVSLYEDTYYLTKAETVSGKVTAYDSSNNKITVDGESYAVGAGTNLAPDLDDAWQDTGANANTNFATPGIKNTDTAENLKNLVDGTYTLYLDASGNVLAYTEDEAAVGNYALVTGSSSSGSAGFMTGKVRLLMADGTTGTYDVDLLASAKKWNSTVDAGTNNTTKEDRMANLMTNNAMAGTVVTYTLNNSTVTLGQPDYTNSKYDKVALTANTLKFQSSISSYTIGGVKVMADNSTAFFVKDGNGNFSAIAGLSKLRASGITATNASVIYYTPTNSSTKVAKAIYVETNDKYASSVDYAYIISTATKTTENNTTIYTYPVVFVDGTMETVKSKDGNLNDETVYSFTRDSDGYLSFGSENVVNNKIVTSSNRGAVGVTDVKNAGASDSYPVPSSAKIWNVADADVTESGSVWDTSFSRDDKVAIALDEDGNVKAGFVIDSVDTSNMTVAPTNGNVTPTVADADGNNLSAAQNKDLAINGGTAYWNNATGDLTLNLTLATGQSANYTVNVTKNGATTKTVDNLAFGTSKVLYTSVGDDNGTKVDVSVTISQTDKTDRVINYSFVVNSAKSGIPTVAETTVAESTGAIGTVDDTNKDNNTYTWNDAQDNGILNMKFNPLTVTAKVTDVELTGGLKAAGAITVGTYFTANTDKAIYTVQDKDSNEAGTIKVTVAFQDGAKVPVEVTYTFVINHAALYTLDKVGVAETKEYEGATISVGSTGTYAKITENGVATYAEIASYTTMPAKDVRVLEDGYYAVATPDIATGTRTGYAGTITAEADKAYAKSGEAVTVTVKGTADAAASATGGCSLAYAATGGGTPVYTPASPKTVTQDDLKSGFEFSFTVAIGGTAADITAITITPTCS